MKNRLQTQSQKKRRVEKPGETASICEENWETGSCWEGRTESDVKGTVDCGRAWIKSANKEKEHAHMGNNRHRRFIVSPLRQKYFFLNKIKMYGLMNEASFPVQRSCCFTFESIYG